GEDHGLGAESQPVGIEGADAQGGRIEDQSKRTEHYQQRKALTSRQRRNQLQANQRRPDQRQQADNGGLGDQRTHVERQRQLTHRHETKHEEPSQHRQLQWPGAAAQRQQQKRQQGEAEVDMPEVEGHSCCSSQASLKLTCLMNEWFQEYTRW